MRFVEVKELPKSRYNTGSTIRLRHNYIQEFECFMSMNMKIARVIPDQDEFPDVRIAVDNMRSASAKHGFPISVLRRNSEIYFVRRDI